MKYSNFLAIGRLFGALAWILGILTFITCLVSGVMLSALPEADGSVIYIVLGIAGGIISGFLTFILLYAISQFIYVSIDIERNTRQTLRALLEEVETEEADTEETEAEEGDTEEGLSEEGQ